MFINNATRSINKRNIIMANIYCHSCLRNFCCKTIKQIKKQGKYYYCNNQCLLTA